MHSPTSATIAIDKRHQPDWRFDIDQLQNHTIASAIGPVSEAIDSFKVTKILFFKYIRYLFILFLYFLF